MVRSMKFRHSILPSLYPRNLSTSVEVNSTKNCECTKNDESHRQYTWCDACSGCGATLLARALEFLSVRPAMPVRCRDYRWVDTSMNDACCRRRCECLCARQRWRVLRGVEEYERGTGCRDGDRAGTCGLVALDSRNGFVSAEAAVCKEG